MSLRVGSYLYKNPVLWMEINNLIKFQFAYYNVYQKGNHSYIDLIFASKLYVCNNCIWDRLMGTIW